MEEIQQSSTLHIETDKRYAPYLLTASYRGFLTCKGHYILGGVIHWVFHPKSRAIKLIERFQMRTAVQFLSTIDSVVNRKSSASQDFQRGFSQGQFEEIGNVFARVGYGRDIHEIQSRADKEFQDNPKKFKTQLKVKRKAIERRNSRHMEEVLKQADATVKEVKKRDAEVTKVLKMIEERNKIDQDKE